MNNDWWVDLKRAQTRPFDMSVAGGRSLNPDAGGCHVPGDKSISHRVVVLSLAMRGKIVIKNMNRGAAVSVLLPALELLGAGVSSSSEATIIEMPSDGSIREPQVPLDLGGSS